MLAMSCGGGGGGFWKPPLYEDIDASLIITDDEDNADRYAAMWILFFGGITSLETRNRRAGPYTHYVQCRSTLKSHFPETVDPVATHFSQPVFLYLKTILPSHFIHLYSLMCSLVSVRRDFAAPFHRPFADWI